LHRRGWGRSKGQATGWDKTGVAGADTRNLRVTKPAQKQGKKIKYSEKKKKHRSRGRNPRWGQEQIEKKSVTGKEARDMGSPV